MSETTTDCLACRLTSGGGLLGGGLYVIYSSRKLAPPARYVVSGIGLGLCLLGSCRILNLPPFRRNRALPALQNESKEDEYIVGKYPKYQK